MKRFLLTTQYKTKIRQDVALNAETEDEAVKFLMAAIDPERCEGLEIIEIREIEPLTDAESAALQTPTTGTIQ